MKPIASRLPGRLSVRAGGVALVLLLAGCNNIFVPKHRVLVDAIAAPGLEQKFSGLSYRLIARKSAVANAVRG